jgi:hypothetical protein
MPDTQPQGPTAGLRDAEDITDDVEDLGEDLFDLTGDEIQDELDVGDLDDLVNATRDEPDYDSFEEPEDDAEDQK